MVIYEDIGNGLTKAYSSSHLIIHGGEPEGDYAEAIDPTAAGRTYVETGDFVPTAADDGVRKWTPLSIKRACVEKWSEVKAALVAADLYEDFIMAQELREDDDDFKRGIAWACATYGEDTVETILLAASSPVMSDDALTL